MSDTDLTTPGDPPEDPAIRAGEYVLGLLEGAERAAAQRELLTGGAFGEAVQWWEQHLAPLGEDAPPVQPSEAVWRAVEARIGTDSAPVSAISRPEPQAAPSGMSGWRLGLAMTGVAVAAAIVALAIDPLGSPQIPAGQVVNVAGPQLIAQLQDADGKLQLATRIDPGGDRLTLAAAGLTQADDAAFAPELWVVPTGGAPISLGLIPGDGDFSRELTDEEQGLLIAGATIAVTIEDRSTAPHAAPTSEILLAGSLTAL